MAWATRSGETWPSQVMVGSTSRGRDHEVTQGSVARDDQALLGVEAAAASQRPGVEEAVDPLGLVEPPDVEDVAAGSPGGARVGHPGRADRDPVGGKAVGDSMSRMNGVRAR